MAHRSIGRVVTICAIVSELSACFMPKYEEVPRDTGIAGSSNIGGRTQTGGRESVGTTTGENGVAGMGTTGGVVGMSSTTGAGTTGGVVGTSTTGAVTTGGVVGTSSTTNTCVVTGTVFNENNQVVPGVAVEFRQGDSTVQHDITDSAGAFTIQSIELGSYTVTINATLYYVVSTGGITGKDFDLQVLSDPITLDSDTNKSYVLPYRRRNLLAYDVASKSATLVQTDLTVNSGFLQVLDDDSVLLQELASQDVFKLNMSTGSRTPVVQGGTLGQKLDSVVQLSQDFYYASEDLNHILTVASFDMAGAIQERARLDLSASPNATSGTKQVAYDGQQILIASVRSSGMDPLLTSQHLTLFSYSPSTLELKEYLGEGASPDWRFGYPVLFDNRGASAFVASVIDPIRSTAPWTIYTVSAAGYAVSWADSNGVVSGLLHGVTAFNDSLFILANDGTLTMVANGITESGSLPVNNSYGAFRAQSAERLLVLLDK